ncbi:MAG: sulfatase-like hydrolase/transferase [Luteitalea sp.]|nr:sulfatase-like hydrolase/transferase [Luteitalea sp.]
MRLRASSIPTTDEPLLSYRVWASLYVAAVWFFLGMEWLFFVTKPSFLSVLPWGERVIPLGAATLPVLLAGLSLLGLVWLVGRSMPTAGLRCASRWLLQLPPAFVLLASGLLLVDNFTHTLFGWGIRSLDRSRLWYAGAVLLAGALIYVWVGRMAATLHTNARSRQRWARSAAALATAAGLAAVVEVTFTSSAAATTATTRTTKGRPNILLVGLDGVNADHMSVYGYTRQTTPFLETLGRESLVFPNAFSNGGNTAGSLTAILTGRAPTTTRVIYAPDILRGRDTALHLPAFLRALGYRTGQFAVRHFAASVDFNMRGAFDVVNNQSRAPGIPGAQVAARLGPGRFLFDQVLLRVRARVEQLAGERGSDPFEQVTETLGAQFGDETRMLEVTRFIQDSNEPFFAHVHIMVTHGPKFGPRERHFSAGMTQDTERIREFYDDAILDGDAYVRDIVDLLEARGAFANTLVVVYSDHGARFQTNVRLPLMVRLPGGARRGRPGVTAQMIDIAPTVLDVLGIRAPRWMEGQSLLGEVTPCRPVFGAISTTPEPTDGGGLATVVAGPPFYSLGVATLVRGNRWLYLKVDHDPPDAHGGRVPTVPGAETCEPFEPEEAKRILIRHLRSKRYRIPASFERRG